MGVKIMNNIGKLKKNIIKASNTKRKRSESSRVSGGGAHNFCHRRTNGHKSRSVLRHQSVPLKHRMRYLCTHFPAYKDNDTSCEWNSFLMHGSYPIWQIATVGCLSKKHSDLYTDEDPKGTIHGLGFKDEATARSSVSKIRKSGRSHAHKIQAAVAMEQRAKAAGKAGPAAIYRKYINSMKKKTKAKNK